MIGLGRFARARSGAGSSHRQDRTARSPCALNAGQGGAFSVMPGKCSISITSRSPVAMSRGDAGKADHGTRPCHPGREGVELAPMSKGADCTRTGSAMAAQSPPPVIRREERHFTRAIQDLRPSRRGPGRWPPGSHPCRKRHRHYPSSRVRNSSIRSATVAASVSTCSAGVPTRFSEPCERNGCRVFITSLSDAAGPCGNSRSLDQRKARGKPQQHQPPVRVSHQRVVFPDQAHIVGYVARQDARHDLAVLFAEGLHDEIMVEQAPGEQHGDGDHLHHGLPLGPAA